MGLRQNWLWWRGETWRVPTTRFAYPALLTYRRDSTGPFRTQIRDVNGVEAARALRRLGFTALRQTGSHLVLRRDGRTVVVPQHNPLKPGTLKGIIEQAGVTLESFVEHLLVRRLDFPPLL